MKNKVYAVAVLMNDYYLMLPNCIKKDSESEDEMKMRYITQRYNTLKEESKELVQKYGKEFKPLNMDKELKRYLFTEL